MALSSGMAAREAARPSRSGHRVFPSVIYGAGFLGVYLGQRILDVGKAANVATALGATLALAALVVRLVRLGRHAQPQARAAERSLVILYLVGVAGLALYVFNSDLYFHLTGATFQQKLPRLSGIIGALWPAAMLAGTLPVLFVELSLAGMKRAPVLDQGRVRAAMLSALGLGFALVFAFSAAYVAAERNKKLDLSYFRTTKASEATRKLVQALDKRIIVYLFFPPANEVFEAVDSYFADLTRESKLLVIERYDHALHPAKAKELNVSGNGIVVFSRDSVRDQMPMPLALESARSQLRTLDQDVHKRLIGVSRQARVAYFTHGHEERTFDPVGETDKRPTIRSLREMLVDQGFEVKDLGLAQGLGTDVPADAQIVFVVGPRKPFLPEEVASLVRYLDRKGRLLLALDPEAGDVLPELLAQLSLKYLPVTLANDKVYWNRSYQKADRINIATGSYSSHASVSTIGRFGQRAPLVLVGAGALEKNEKGAVGIVNVDFTVHAEGSTWNDKNGNFEHDPSEETRNAYELAAAVSKRNASALLPEEEARAVVLTDSDGLTDGVLRNLGNAYLALDAVRWLSGEAVGTGPVNTEEDVPLAHTRKQDVAWFYTTVFAAPVLVLGIGFAMTRRRRQARRKPAAAAPPAPPEAPEAPAPAPGSSSEAAS